jgi:hypothetical protein
MLSQAFGYGTFGFQGSQYPTGVQTTTPGSKTEPIGDNFSGYVSNGLRGNGIVFSLEQVRVQVFAQARFQFRRLKDGRPGELFGTPALRPLEGPYGGPHGSLLARMILDADMAGNFYGVLVEGAVVRLRPDWVDVILSPLSTRVGNVGYERAGYIYWPDGNRSSRSAVPLLASNVVHFAPMPDPLALFRGMSWMTPVAREIMADGAYSRHKLSFIDNAATPNLAIALDKAIPPAELERFVEMMEASHAGPLNAGKTLYLGGGADVTVVGADMHGLDFKAVQGAGETRLAAASGVGAVIAQFSEGMQGSSLNAGNYAASRRRFADVTMRHLWQEAAAALSNVIDVPKGSHLWYDDRDISFLQEDAKDAAEIDQIRAATIRNLVDGGFEPETVVKTVWPDARLTHSGMLSVQLIPPGAAEAEAPAVADEGTPPNDA